MRAAFRFVGFRNVLQTVPIGWVVRELTADKG